MDNLEDMYSQEYERKNQQYEFKFELARGKNFETVKFGEAKFDIPSRFYIEKLEEEIHILKNETRDLKNYIRNTIRNHVNSLTQALNETNQKLDNKMDIIDERF